QLVSVRIDHETRVRATDDRLQRAVVARYQPAGRVTGSWLLLVQPHPHPGPRRRDSCLEEELANRRRYCLRLRGTVDFLCQMGCGDRWRDLGPAVPPTVLRPLGGWSWCGTGVDGSSSASRTPLGVLGGRYA